MKQRNGLRDWSGLSKKEEKEKEDRRNKGGKPFYGEVCPNIVERERGTRISDYWWRQKCLVSMEMDTWKVYSC